MNPAPLIPLALAIACAVAAAASFACGRSMRHSVVLGVAVAFACGLVLPPLLMGALMLVLGDANDVALLFKAMAVLGGLMGLVTAALAIPCGAGAGLLGGGVGLWLDHWSGGRRRSNLTVATVFIIIVVSGIALAAVGGVIGYLLGRFAPSYYRGVYSGGYSPTFDPVQVGLLLGVTQGFIAGLVVGMVVVLVVSICGPDCEQKDPPDLA